MPKENLRFAQMAFGALVFAGGCVIVAMNAFGDKGVLAVGMLLAMIGLIVLAFVLENARNGAKKNFPAAFPLRLSSITRGVIFMKIGAPVSVPENDKNTGELFYLQEIDSGKFRYLWLDQEEAAKYSIPNRFTINTQGNMQEVAETTGVRIQ